MVTCDMKSSNCVAHTPSTLQEIKASSNSTDTNQNRSTLLLSSNLIYKMNFNIFIITFEFVTIKRKSIVVVFAKKLQI